MRTNGYEWVKANQALKRFQPWAFQPQGSLDKSTGQGSWRWAASTFHRPASKNTERDPFLTLVQLFHWSNSSALDLRDLGMQKPGPSVTCPSCFSSIRSTLYTSLDGLDTSDQDIYTSSNATPSVTPTFEGRSILSGSPCCDPAWQVPRVFATPSVPLMAEVSKYCS